MKTLSKMCVYNKWSILFSVELATLTRQNGKTITRILPANEVVELIAAYEKSEAEAEAAKKEKLQQKS